MIGRRLSHYRIEERLGAGGMGEVYRARDEKLGRDVALKVLPPHALGDEEARRRFRREAVVLSRLGHPHIATLFDFDSADGIDFLAMELVLGPTLEQELRQGPLAEKDVLRLGSQLVRGLAAAHEQGVVHRDLKPSNLQLTADGMLKILDFGVARLERAAKSRSDTETATETSPGDVIGSPPYMAPEQLLGKAVDARTDVYAAGACLYEMATGRRPHGDKHGAALTEAILHEAVASPRSKEGALSAGLESVILKCLDKEPGLRYQTAKELAVDLERLQGGSDARAGAGAATGPPRGRRLWPRLLAAVAAAVALVGWLLRPLPPPRITNVRPLHLDLGWVSTEAGGRAATWATDGLRLYYIARRHGEYRLMQVAATGGEPSEIDVPRQMHHGLEIYGFLPEQSALLCLAYPEKGIPWPAWLIPVPQGTARRLGGLTGNLAAASPDGRQVALSQIEGPRLVLARLDGSVKRGLADVPGFGVLAWSPDGRRIRIGTQAPGQDEPWIWELATGGGKPRALWPGRAGTWTPDGRFFVLERWNESERRFDLFSVREKPWALWTRRDPVPLTTGPIEYAKVGPRPDGKGLYALGLSRRAELFRYDGVARQFVSHLDAASIVSVSGSRDGQWIAWSTWPEGALWRSRPDGSQKLQLTPNGRWAGLPRWSPDAKRIVFTGQAVPHGPRSISIVSAEGGSVEVLATPEPGLDHWDACWLDERTVVFSYLQRRRMGLLRLNVDTHQVSPWPGAERLRFPKCGAHGQVFALDGPEALRQAISTDFRVFVPESGKWEPVDVPGNVYANWTRDGKSIIGRNPYAARIERFSLITRRSQTIVDVQGVSLATEEGVGWMGLDAADAPLIARDVSSMDLYALDWEAP